MSNFNFEEEMKKLQNIVTKLEDDNLDLDEAIKNYQLGIETAKACHEKIKEAEELVVKTIENK